MKPGTTFTLYVTLQIILMICISTYLPLSQRYSQCDVTSLAIRKCEERRISRAYDLRSGLFLTYYINLTLHDNERKIPIIGVVECGEVLNCEKSPCLDGFIPEAGGIYYCSPRSDNTYNIHQDMDTILWDNIAFLIISMLLFSMLFITLRHMTLFILQISSQSD